jgi:hypothetical protein
MKSLILLSSLAFSFGCYAEMAKCEFTFENNSSTLNPTEVLNCQNLVKTIKGPIDYSFTFGSASYSGSTIHNANLASTRSEVVAKAFQDLATTKNSFPGGASISGRKAWIVFFSSKIIEKEKIVTQVVEKEKVITNTIEKEKVVTHTKDVNHFVYPTNGEVGFALGDLFVRFGTPAHYKSLQANLTFKASLSDHSYFTYGLLGGIGAREAFKDIWSTYLKVGYSYSNGFAFDLNGLLGGLYVHDQKSLDAGANSFIGLQSGNFKIGIEGAITKNTSFLGLGIKSMF